ncbi:MAG: hypothetical protein DI533_15445 [Cereibacter sphaeroides]|uniref:Class I SAM-dependent methyltransferase n=1 Tax=Cereibacter sphaeroides TaxID=1063 RepID=A0A2W5S4H7_CERSP|nr:MAG: hypothetical protein DI533_15445 [Cereibacter sphaeroides]
MTRILNPTLVDGIYCYSREKADDYADYPDSGFDITEENAVKSFWVSSRNRLFLFLVQRALRKSKGDRFLEIGCGTGDFLSRVVAKKNLDVTGSEIYRKGLRYAKAKMPGITFVQYDVSEGVLDQKFDVIAAFDVLEHVERDQEAIGNIYEMLSENGRFVVSVPQYMFLWSNLDAIVKHKRRYSRREMTGKLRASGFEIERATSFVFTLFPLMVLSRLVDRESAAQVQDDQALQKRVMFSSVSNSLFDAVMRIDEFLIRIGLSLPFGGRLVVVARKPA